MKTKKIIHIAVIVLLTLAATVTALVMCLKINSLDHENAAKRFSRGEKFSQITLFIPESAEFTVDKIMYFRYNIEKKLTEKSMTPPNETARLYVDAFSSYEDINLSSDTSRNANVKAMFVGGDYKKFYKALSEAADVTNDVNHDRILLSRTAAWQLYGGTELYDFRAFAGERNYYVSGVYDDFRGKDYDTFYENRPSCVIDIMSAHDQAVTCYEIIMVNPVKNFAKDIVVNCLDLTEGTYLLVENSERFSLGKLFKKIPTLIASDEPLPVGVNITPEEMMARRAEKELAVMLTIFMIFALYPAIWGIILVFKLIKLVKGLINRYIISKIKDKLSYS